MTMYDLLRATYRFPCPRRPEGPPASVALSSFRRIERLPGAAHPAVYRILFSCACGEEHLGLVDDRDLDYAPLAGASEATFRNLLTGRSEPVANELFEIARSELRRGNWPWRLYCSRESMLTPVYPSSLQLVAPSETGGSLVGVAMRCPRCADVSLNLVSAPHLDVPFYHDPVVRYVERPFGDGRDLTLERFHEELHSGRFDGERRRLGD